jgi:hypothetical protein
MLDEARTAELVVVGSRGLGGFTGLLVGSVSSRLAAHAPCPVVVMRAPHALCGAGVGPPAGCVVGVDDPSTAEDIVGFAFAEASRSTSGSQPSIAPSRFRPATAFRPTKRMRQWPSVTS